MQQTGQIDFRSIALVLWLHKWLIGAATVASASLGIAWAYSAKNVYYSEAIITPKSSGSDSRQGVLSQIGGLGFMASQLGMGSSNLDHLEVMLKSRVLAEKVVADNALLPKLFPYAWDAAKSGWKPMKEGETPTVRDGIERIASGMIKVKTESKKQLITLGFEAPDPRFSSAMVEMYLLAFNQMIQSNVRRDADSNRSYLESQMAATADPLLREKIQSLIAGQMEKSMLVSSSSFDILEKPFVPSRPTRPRRMMMVLFALSIGLLLSSFFVLVRHAFQSSGAGAGGPQV